MKKIKLLDGKSIEMTEKCKGCFLLKNNICNYLTPIYETEKIIVNQDMEYPIPAFYIISTKKHIASIYNMDTKTRQQISDTMYLIRTALIKCLEVERVTIIQEEKDNSSHFHIWMLPIWKNIKEDINPRVIKNNIEHYMNLFNFEENKEKILECNDKMRKFLNYYIYK